MENHLAPRRGYDAFALLLMAEVVALALFQSPAERFVRYIAFDSGVDLTMQDLMARGYRPTVDFGCAYGLLPLLVNRAWYGIAGLTPGAYRAEVVLGTCLTAWGMARFAGARRVGPAGLALIALSMPDVLFSTYNTSVHVFEPALLVHGLAEQARGRRGTALAFATAACFVKPSLGYVYGLVLLICILLAAKGTGPGILAPFPGPGGGHGDRAVGRGGRGLRGGTAAPDDLPDGGDGDLSAGGVRLLPGDRPRLLGLAGGEPARLLPV